MKVEKFPYLTNSLTSMDEKLIQGHTFFSVDIKDMTSSQTIALRRWTIEINHHEEHSLFLMITKDKATIVSDHLGHLQDFIDLIKGKTLIRNIGEIGSIYGQLKLDSWELKITKS